MKIKNILSLAAVTVVALTSITHAALQSQVVEYKQGNTALQGYLVYDDAFKGPRPGILVVHDWLGEGVYPRMRAEQLAKLGYVAFSADIYGKGRRAQNPEQALKLATEFKSNRPLMRKRAQAALEVLKKNPQVNPLQTAAIGYCFGGTVVLELARSGADMQGFVSFHGGLDTPKPNDAKNIKAPVLVLHGAVDPYAPKEQVDAMKKEFDAAKVKYEVVLYPGAVHAFTIKAAGNDVSKGAAYNAAADKKSWSKMQEFFKGIFKK